MRKFTFNANQTTAQQQFIAAASQNPRKPWISVRYRDDILCFDDPVGSGASFGEDIPHSFKPISGAEFLFAGWKNGNTTLHFGGNQFANLPTLTGFQVFGGQDSTTYATFTGSIYKGGDNQWRYHFLRYPTNSTPGSATGYTATMEGAVNGFSSTGLPSTYVTEVNGKYSIRRPSAFIVMEHGDKVAVYTSYEFMSGINQFVCTMSFYYASFGSTTYTRLRTTIQYDVDPPPVGLSGATGIGVCRDLDHTSGCVFGSSTAAGKFFIIANDGTKAVRFTYNLGVEGMLEPIIPIDLDANRLEITDSVTSEKTYGKYHQFMPHALTKMGGKYYLNGRMIRTYSNGDRNVMEVYLWSDDGVNWAVGDVSFFIDAKYYKKGQSAQNYLYSLVYPDGGNTVYAVGSDCYTKAVAREIDKQISGTDFTSIVIHGELQGQSNSADSIGLMVMRGFDGVDPDVLGGKTISLDLGYYDANGSVLAAKMGEYFVDSEMHVFNSAGRGPNKVVGADSGAWKLTRWSSITDIDRWSSTALRDDLKKLSKLIVKGISSDYKAVDNATASGLYLSNLNDPFVGYTSTKDDRDGMFTVCARFTDTGSTVKLSSIGLLIGAEDYTDIYTNGAADRKGWNAYMIPAASTWTGKAKTGPEMRKSNLKRRFDDPGTVADESDVDRAYQWVRRNTGLWERSTYIADGSADSPYNKITAAAAAIAGTNVIYAPTESSAFVAQHGVDYEFVMRKQSGRMQLYQRKKGFTNDTVAASAYTDYTLIHEYQFGKDDRISWGPRPYWGFVANTDVFSSLDGWNAREYGNIETSLTEAYNIVNGFSDFPDSNLASYGYQDVVGQQGGYQTIVIPGETQQFYSEGSLEIIETKKPVSYQIFVGEVLENVSYVEDGPVQNLHVGEIVRCLIFSDNGGATTGSVINNPPNNAYNVVREGAGQNITPRAEFISIITAIETTQDGRKRIRFGRRWSLGSPTYIVGEQFDYAIYKIGYGDQYAKAFSGSTTSNVLLDMAGNTLALDLKPGAVKQATTTAGKAAFVNRQNDAIFTRIVGTDGVSHSILSGSRYVNPQTGIGGTNLGFDYPTNPISNKNFVGSNGLVTTREWRMLLYQGRLLPFSASSIGLPSGFGNNNRAYMIKGDEIVRYTDFSWQNRGTDNFTTWCVIPTYYTPIFPSVKGQTSVQQWSKLSPTVAQVTVDQPTSNQWIEPGDKFSEIQNLSGLRVYINGKSGYYAVEGDVKHYAVSATASNDAGTASTLTFSPALKAGADFISVDDERAKDSDKQIKEIAVVSGREQFGTGSGLQDYTDPLCFYPVGNAATAAPDSFIKVHYWTMNAGLYNSAKDNLKYVCNLAGISDVQFMDKTGTVINGTTETVYAATSTDAGLANFLVEMSAKIDVSSQIAVRFRSAYKLSIDVDTVTSGAAANRGHLLLTLQTVPGFEQAKKIDGNSTGSNFCTIARVSIPVADIPLTGVHDFRVAVRKERVVVEMDNMPVWTFDLKTYTFDGDKNDRYTLFTDARGPITIQASGLPDESTGVDGKISYTLVELSEEVENQIVDMSQGGGESVQFITRERHIYTRSTQNGGLQFGRFLDGNRDTPATGAALPTENYIKDQLEHNPFQVPGHVLVTGAEYGEHIDPAWIRQNGYMFNTNQNRLLDTVEDSIKEAKLLIRMMKEESDSSDMEMIGMPHVQPEDGINKTYEFPEQVPQENQQQIVSGHVIQFDQTTMKSVFKIRKKYSLE